MQPKSLLHCHSKNLHSVIIGRDVNGNLIRMFVATKGHALYKNSLYFLLELGHLQELAIHSHKSDITIIPLTGTLYNITASKVIGDEKDIRGITTFNQFEYHSPILNQKGQFRKIQGETTLKLSSQKVTHSVHLPHSTLHTVYVPEQKEATWLVVEGKYTNTPSLLSYSNNDLTIWDDSELYQKMDKETEERLISQYFHNQTMILPTINSEIDKFTNKELLIDYIMPLVGLSRNELINTYNTIYTNVADEVNNGLIHSNRYSPLYVPDKSLKKFKDYLITLTNGKLNNVTNS